MRLRVLTHTFPPSTHANAKRPFYVVRHALAQGWEVEVITSFWAVPPGNPETLHHPRLRIRRWHDPVLDWQRRFQSWPVLYRWAVYLSAAVMFPDACASWARGVLKYAQGALPADRTVAYILPASWLLAGRMGSVVNRSWVFDYQEPVTPQQLRLKRRSPLQRLWRKRLQNLERATLHQAGRILFTSETNRQAYVRLGLAPAERTVHVPYFYDASVFERPAPEPAPGFEVVYFGTFDWRGARSPETFLCALAEFLRVHPEARAQTRFRLHGQWPALWDARVRELALADVFIRGRMLDYEEYLEEVRRSPILLLVVSPAHDLYMPSKIVDYLGARRPILGMVPSGSEMHALLVKAGFGRYCADPGDIAGTRSLLEQLWEAYRWGTLQAPPGDRSFWSSETQLPFYLQLVESASTDPILSKAGR
ncbi:MAG: hypothetical protein RMN51_11365 [Verrucomicrobiota bacterium]|nr:hypothetical protein [Limisphaera sp.]MDW8382687.1 hypothetical protein [Verrucomicrobiota bacterium]